MTTSPRAGSGADETPRAPGATESSEKAGTPGKTSAGNYFVSNYPPYSFWKPAFVGEALAAVDREPDPAMPLGVYLHIPFCRKRCHFCYFRVYTNKNAKDIQHYLDAAVRELELYAERPFIGGRKPKLVYFGGGTPSYLSTSQLTTLSEEMKRLLPWDDVEEVTFECEPGTLTESKLRFLRDMGVTRLSLGVEHFDQAILERNGRAHGAKEIDRAYGFAQSMGFPQINIDLIAGMMGETEEGWHRVIEKAGEMAPDSITLYPMEVPFNTTIYQEMQAKGEAVAPVADWATKHRWIATAFERLEALGYTVTSHCTAVKNPADTRFVYRENLFGGSDLIGLGVASFGHVGGTHYQNEHDWDPYIARLDAGELPIYRALTPTDEERLVREVALQFKMGHADAAHYRAKFGVDIRERFAPALDRLADQGHLTIDGDHLRFNRDALLQADRLIREFFLPEHRDARYA